MKLAHHGNAHTATHAAKGGTHTSHHKGTHHHKGKHHKKKSTAPTGKALVRQMLSQGGGAISKTDQQFSQLVNQVASALMGGGFAATIIAAIEAVVNQQISQAPGHLIAGKISTNAGALQAASGGDTNLAMVFLNGSTTAVPCYVPPNLWADLAIGQDVWVAPANGQRQDLAIHSIRNFTSAPASSSYLNGSSTLNGANVSGAVASANSVPASGVGAGNLGTGVAAYPPAFQSGAIAAGVTMAIEQLTSGAVNGINGTAGTLFWSMPIRTTGLKIVCIYLSGYGNTNATPQNFVLPVDFSAGATVITLHSAVGGTGFVFRTPAGAIISANQVALGTGGSGGSATAHNNVFAYSLQNVDGVIHSIDSPISTTSTGTGPVFIVGF